MKEIPLTRGFIATVDDEDYEMLIRFKWTASYDRKTKTPYAVFGKMVKNKGLTIYMHRLLLNPCNGMHVDHIDGNGLNNRRANLRIASRSNNMANQGRHRDNLSGFKGVTASRKSGWRASICVNRKKIGLGTFSTPELAHAAYCAAAGKYHGKFARFA